MDVAGYQYFIPFQDWIIFQCVYVCVCVYILFIHSSGDGHSLATVNNAVISTDVQVSVLVPGVYT